LRVIQEQDSPGFLTQLATMWIAQNAGAGLTGGDKMSFGEVAGKSMGGLFGGKKKQDQVTPMSGEVTPVQAGGNQEPQGINKNYNPANVAPYYAPSSIVNPSLAQSLSFFPTANEPYAGYNELNNKALLELAEEKRRRDFLGGLNNGLQYFGG